MNVFVATDPMAIPATGVAAQGVPNPRKPIPFDDKADPAVQQMVFGFSMDLRESVEPVFRKQFEQTWSYVAGASYPWDELRRDQRNYSLIVWPTRSSAQSQQIDVYAVLVHEATGRRVWQQMFADPYGTRKALAGSYSRAERLAIVRAMAEKMIDDMKRKGVLAGSGAARTDLAVF
ncbi:hypothetical protein ABVT11_08900 [Uliginosibacterium paludis]|uniref:Uncharacterized protein n=2 Tax=Uliginosibacterium paludis TaxID=1615952 RepID=A0ABV2CPV3_9RHOO